MFKSNILKAWTASFVRRWHTHPQLSWTDDFNGGHQQRSTLLLILFWPDSTRGAIIDCLTHDQGEDDAGDMAYSAKKKFPEVREMLHTVENESIEQQGFPDHELSDLELERRRWVDLLDSYLWMLKNKPRLRVRREWETQARKLSEEAIRLGIANKYWAFIGEAKRYFTDEEWT